MLVWLQMQSENPIASQMPVWYERLRRTQMANKEQKETVKKKKPAQSTLKEKRAVKEKKKTSKPK